MALLDGFDRKARANALLPQEHQRLDVLRRQEKKEREAVQTGDEKLNILRRRQGKLEAEIEDLRERKDTVSFYNVRNVSLGG